MLAPEIIVRLEVMNPVNFLTSILLLSLFRNHSYIIPRPDSTFCCCLTRTYLKVYVLPTAYFGSSYVPFWILELSDLSEIPFS